eukprot:849056-Pyramimonas_sp.AAC.1
MVGNVEPLRPLAPWQPPLSRRSFWGWLRWLYACTGRGCCGWMGSARPASPSRNDAQASRGSS